MINIVKTLLKIKDKEIPANVSIEVSEAGKLGKGDIISVLKVAGITALATLATTIATHLTELKIDDPTVLVFIPLVSAGLNAIARFLMTTFTTKVKV
jgi:hypothetical protein